MWTRRDDELIMAFTRGWMSVEMLQERLQRSRRAISNRAKELGVKLPTMRSTHPRQSHPRPKRKIEEPKPIDRLDFQCVTGIEDPLLERLRKHHGERK